MFSVDEPTANAIRHALDESGELAAIVELRRHFPLIGDNAHARICVRMIASWGPTTRWKVRVKELCSAKPPAPATSAIGRSPASSMACAASRGRAINEDAVWQDDQWRFKHSGPAGGYADNYDRLQAFVAQLRRSRQ